MALTNVQTKPLNALQIISRNDDAIDAEASDWEKYDETLDPVHLKMLPGKMPTTFLCNFDLTAKERAMINNALISGVDDDGKPKVGLGTWQLTVAKLVLKDIQNPDYIPEAQRIILKKEGRGYPDDRTLNTLSKLGVISEIHTHFTRQTEGGARPAAKNS